MSYFQSLILSLIEGITEFLPVSSTAHLVLASQLLKIEQTNFVKSFEIIIQLGAILAVIVLYFKNLYKDVKLWFKIFLAFLPTAVIGYFLYDLIKHTLLGNNLVSAWALILGGVAFIAIEKFGLKDRSTNKGGYTAHTLTPKRLFFVGLMQSLAVIPGVSRAAASMFGGMLAGLSRSEAAKFSFYLAIPTMLAASALDLYKSQLSFTPVQIQTLIIGFIGSFIVALFVIKVFIKFVQRHTFFPFGIYRIVVGFIWLLIY